jgi:hypothetical protein
VEEALAHKLGAVRVQIAVQVHEQRLALRVRALDGLLVGRRQQPRAAARGARAAAIARARKLPQ